MKKKTVARTILYLFLAAAVVGGLTGCNGGSGRQEPVTISFAFPMEDRDYYQAAVEQFNKDHPKITIELESSSGDLLGGINPGEADTFVTSQFAQLWLRDRNMVLNLSSLADQDSDFDLDDFYRGIPGLFTERGKLWGIPAGMDVMVMYYNRELFERYGAPLPEPGWTWNDFLQAAAMIRDPSADVFGYTTVNPVFDAMAFIYQHGGRLFDDLQDPTEITFDDPAAAEGLQWYIDLTFTHNVAPNPAQTRASFGMSGMERAYIANGRSGMWTGMLSEADNEYIEDLETGIAPLPRDEMAAALTLAQGYFISADTEAPDACWTWLTYLSRRIPPRLVPVRKSLLESKQYKREAEADYALIVEQALENAILLSPELAVFEKSVALFSRAVESIMREEAPAAAALKAAQQVASQLE